jgi:superkiller protein 3
MKGNDVSNSISKLHNSISLYPMDKQIYWSLGFYYKFKQDYAQAIYYFERVLNLDPNDKKTLVELGYTYFFNNDHEKSLECLQRYIDVAPDEANPYDSMGEIYFRMNDYKNSIEMYKRALEIKHDFSPSQRGLTSNYIKMGECQKARDQLYLWSKVAESYQDQELILKLLATTYTAEGDIEKTLKELNKINNLAKQESDTLLWIRNIFNESEILYENEKIAEAEEKLAAGKRVLESSEYLHSTLWYYWHLTRIALKKENIELAKMYKNMYKKNVENSENPYFQKMYFTLSGLIAYAEENYEKSISDIEQSNHQNAFERYYLGLAYLKNGDKIKAIEKFESAVNYTMWMNRNNEIARIRAEQQLEKLETE